LQFSLVICAECLGDLKTLKDENKDLRRLLNKASQILQNNGFENESKAIDCMAEL
jgi:hypothetical protein